MRKILGAALLATAIAPAAQAEGEVSGNIAYTSDYTFRGYSNSMEDPALQGGFDWASEHFYAGTWASTIDFGIDAPLEVDVYAGYTPTIGPVTLDLGIIAYLYPGSTDELGEIDFVEVSAGAKVSPIEALELGAAVFYSPEFALDGGEAWYLETNAAYALNDRVGFSGALGYQDVELDGWFGGIANSYTTWNAGVTFQVAGFGIDLRYHDTDLDLDLMDERAVVTLSRAL